LRLESAEPLDGIIMEVWLGRFAVPRNINPDPGLSGNHVADAAGD
jgi:hypothetical protein